jgi:putative Ca2+/H+ antiporter (TMEM165/GDT1 family)
MDITPFLTSFWLIALAEFGDKTQLTVIALSAMYDRHKVFSGVVLAFALVTGLGVVVGDGLLRLVDPEYLRILAGLLFLVFGILILFSKMDSDTIESTRLASPFFSTFWMISIAELGDKTQLSAIALAAKYDSPVLVFGGAVLALVLISLLGIVAGRKLVEKVSMSKIKAVSGVMFVVFGVLFLAGF